MTDKQIRKLERLERLATPGPWTFRPEPAAERVEGQFYVASTQNTATERQALRDARFIMAARLHLGALVQESRDAVVAMAEYQRRTEYAENMNALAWHRVEETVGKLKAAQLERDDALAARDALHVELERYLPAAEEWGTALARQVKETQAAVRHIEKLEKRLEAMTAERNQLKRDVAALQMALNRGTP